MSCSQAELRLHAYLDGELDAQGAAEFERHLESCPDCENRLAAESRLGQALRTNHLYETAPATLRQKLDAALPGAKPPAIQRNPMTPSWLWLAAAAALLLVAILGWRQFEGVNGRGYQQALATAVVDAHLRSMQPGHLADVISTDQHTVKPWFDGKLTFAPPVKDYVSDGFPLMGGRLDVLDGRTAAALVYGRRKHIINVFVVPDQAGETWSGSGQLQGYHWVAWQQAGFSFCAVSDVSTADLEQLKQFFLSN